MMMDKLNSDFMKSTIFFHKWHTLWSLSRKHKNWFLSILLINIINILRSKSDRREIIFHRTHPDQRPDIKLSRKQSVLHHLRKMSQSVDVRTRKTTMMLFFITLVFVVSYLPHLVIKAIQAMNKDFIGGLSTTSVICYNIFVRSYFFNAAANAFVYGFCSPKFRHECRILFLRLAFWVKTEKITVQNEDLMWTQGQKTVLSDFLGDLWNWYNNFGHMWPNNILHMKVFCYIRILGLGGGREQWYAL